jgi:hypothetical protein
MQSSLDRILTAVQPQSQIQGLSPHPSNYPNIPSTSREGHYSPHSAGARNGYDGHNSPGDRQPNFPPLPGFPPPVCNTDNHSPFVDGRLQPHRYATYGIVPSTAPSSEDESEDTLPRATINAPIEALQGLANAAAEAAAAAPSGSRCGYIFVSLPLTERAVRKQSKKTQAR